MVDHKISLLPRIGKLYPSGSAKNESDEMGILDSYEPYRGIWGYSSGDQTIEDVFHQEASMMYVDAF
jgi:hypothetical protein